MDKLNNMNYKSKSNDSFNSRLRFYVFKCALTKEDLHKKAFLEFDVDENPALEFVELYITEYQQFESNHKIVKHNKSKRDNNALYSKMKVLDNENKTEIDSWREDYFKDVFKKKLNESDFKKFGKVKCCGYCGITLDEINELASNKKLFKKNERGFNLELDRKSPNKEYSTKNCIMACYWCNNAKTDEFSAEEFASIGKAIGAVLRNRLLKN